MAGKKPSAPGYVVLQGLPNGQWRLLGEVPRRPGLSARDARSQAILEASDGKAREGERYAAILRSEWKLAMDWGSAKKKR